MSVANNDLANENTFNTSFMSREVDTDTVGAVNFKNPTEAGDDTGGVRVQGGLYVAKEIYATSVIRAKAGVEFPNGAHTIVNNQASAANVTGLSFNSASVRTAKVEWQIVRIASGGLARVQAGAFYVCWNGTAWELTDLLASATFAGVVFAIDSATGQVTYTSDDNGGSYDAAKSVLKWEIVKKTA